MPSRTVYLPDETDARVQALVENGEFDNRSKVIQKAIERFLSEVAE